MLRQNPIGARDETPLTEASDLAFAGIDMRAPPLVQPGFVSSAKNMRLVDGLYESRRGLFAPTWTRYASDDFPYRASFLTDDEATYIASYATTYGAGVFSDPGEDGETWIVRVCATALVFTRETVIGRIIEFLPGLTVTGPVQVVQNFNELIIVRGDDNTSLKWSGDWVDAVGECVPDSVPSSYAAVPNAHFALAWRERLALLSGRDGLVLSRIADNTLYETGSNSAYFYINRGRGDVLRSAAPLGAQSILILKSQSAHVFTANTEDLSDARLDEVPVAMQFDSPHTTISADGKVWWLDRRGIRTAQISAVNADNKVLVEVKVVSDFIAPLIRRINWKYASLFTAGVTEERIYFAVALDSETTPQTLLVWNRQNGGAWESYDQNALSFGVLAFAPAVPWLNSPRLFAVDASGRQVCLDYMLGEDTVAYTADLPVRVPIASELLTRGYTAGTNDPKKFARAQVQIDTWNPTVALTAVFDGPGESQTLAAIARNRLRYFTTTADFDITNQGGDFHTAKRQDYSTALATATPASGYSNWGYGYNYTVGDNVYYTVTGRNYRCIANHLSVRTDAPGVDSVAWPYYWTLIGVDPLAPGSHTGTLWSVGLGISLGDRVSSQGSIYAAIGSFTTLADNNPLAVPTNWTDLGLDTAILAGGGLYVGTAGIRCEDFQAAIERRDIQREAAWCQLSIAGTAGAFRLRSVALETLPGSRSNLLHA